MRQRNFISSKKKELFHKSRPKNYSLLPAQSLLFQRNKSVELPNSSRRPYNINHRLETLKEFQQELSMGPKISKYRKISKKAKTIEAQAKKQLGDIKIELKNIKYEFEKRVKDDILHNKVSQLYEYQQDLIKQKRSSYLPAIVNPYPIPYNSNYSTVVYHDSESDEENYKYMEKKQRRNRGYLKKKSKRKFNKKQKQELRRKCRKVFYAVSYIFFLKNLTKKLIAKRKQSFKELWPSNFLSFTKKIGQLIFSSFRLFYDKMYAMADVQLTIQGSETTNILNQKIKLNKGIMKLLISCCGKLVNEKQFKYFCQIIHQFCKHGAQASRNALTQQQLETVCISQVYGYLRMDKALEKSQIINFLFFKLIIYNSLLQPWKHDKNKFSIRNRNLYNNFYFFSSVFYEIMNEIQEDLIDSDHVKSIDIGNWREVSKNFKIKYSPSLCHLEHSYEKGQMISGLIPEKIMVNMFPENCWRKQKQQISQILELIHKKMSSAHQQFINTKVYNYKR